MERASDSRSLCHRTSKPDDNTFPCVCKATIRDLQTMANTRETRGGKKRLRQTCCRLMSEETPRGETKSPGWPLPAPQQEIDRWKEDDRQSFSSSRRPTLLPPAFIPCFFLFSHLCPPPLFPALCFDSALYLYFKWLNYTESCGENYGCFPLFFSFRWD